MREKQFLMFLFVSIVLLASVHVQSSPGGAHGFGQKINIQDADNVLKIPKPEQAISFQCNNIADVDNDGYADLVIQEYVQDVVNLRVIYGKSLAAPQSAGSDWTENTALLSFRNFSMRDSRTGDINGDGKKDIIVLGYSGTDGNLSLYVVEAPGVPGERIIQKENLDELQRIVGNYNISIRGDFQVVDMDGDGLDDVMFHNSITNPAPWSIFNIDALFIVYGDRELPLEINILDTDHPVARILFDTTYSNFSPYFTSGNFNPDSKREVIMQHGIKHDYYYRDLVKRQLLFKGTTHLLYGDLIVKPDTGVETVDMRINRLGITNFTTNIKKEYDSAGRLNLGYIEARLASGDLNGDGYDEAIMSYYRTIENEEELSHIYVLQGSSDLLYGTNLDEMGSGVIDIYGGFGDGSHFDQGDINGDGYNDLLIGCTDNWFYIVYGRDSFPENIYLTADTSQITTVTGAQLAACGDINNDGFSDIVANGSNGVYILFGSGERHPLNEAVSRDVPRGRESRFNYLFANETSFQFDFQMGRPYEGAGISISNYGRALPDSVEDIPAGEGVVSFFDIGLTNISSSYRLNCSFGYTDSLINASGIKETDLSVSYWDEAKSQWAKVPVERDTVLNRVSFTTSHLSLWALVDINDPIVASVDEESGSLPQTFELFQNYPNPFNPITTIHYQVASRAEVSLKIYNILGQEIRTLVNGPVAEGNYEIQWDGTDNLGRPVSSGIYIYRMTTDAGFAATRKLVLLR